MVALCAPCLVPVALVSKKEHTNVHSTAFQAVYRLGGIALMVVLAIVEPCGCGSSVLIEDFNDSRVASLLACFWKKKKRNHGSSRSLDLDI